MSVTTNLMDEAKAMTQRAAANEPFSDQELDAAVTSLQCLVAEGADVDWPALRELYASRAHLKHKEWAVTCESATQLAAILGGPDSAAFRQIFSRVLSGGNWDAAATTAASRAKLADADRPAPWVVLVTGLNGIRKTTSVHQPWFKELLREALGEDVYSTSEPLDGLPGGGDSFFRQLDFMITTLALEQFKLLYTIDDVKDYATYKAAIFARYRTVAEMLGVLLMREAKRQGLNVMAETSGRDVGMYEYIEHLFPEDDGSSYRKLVVNFEINELRHAEASVDIRMLNEMKLGKAALEKADEAPNGIVEANAGGPYGSAVLAGVQADSAKVWEQIAAATEKGQVGYGWYKAAIRIDADESKPWTARARPLQGGEAAGMASFEFGPPPK